MKKRHGPEQVVAKLRQADVALGKGLKVPEVCRQLGSSEQTYYRWRQKYGGMAPKMAEHLKAREQENARLKRLHRLWKQEHLQVPRKQRQRPHPARRRSVARGRMNRLLYGVRATPSVPAGEGTSIGKRGQRPRAAY